MGVLAALAVFAFTQAPDDGAYKRDLQRFCDAERLSSGALKQKDPMEHDRAINDWVVPPFAS